MYKRTEWWVGLFAVLAFAALLFLTFRVSNFADLKGGDTYTVYAWFEETGGLRAQSPITISGVVVGRVAEVELDEARMQAKVALRIDEAYALPEDTSASILTAGILGEKYVGLLVGGSEFVLEDGGRILDTQSALLLETVVSKFLVNQ